MRRTLLILFAIAIVFVGLALQPITPPHALVSMAEELAKPNPLPIRNSVFLEELTWIEIRDVLRDGTISVIIPTGGIEQSGPYLPLGKHNYIVRHLAEAIARKRGKTLVAPVIPFVFEGPLDGSAGHMRYPGAITVRDETFSALISDIVHSLSLHGFKDFIFIGDSGDNQRQLQETADHLSNELPRSRIVFIPEYYNYRSVERFLEEYGYHQVSEGIHDDLAFTAELAALEPNLIRYNERTVAGLLSINGIDLSDLNKVQALGKSIFDMRVSETLTAIEKALSSR